VCEDEAPLPSERALSGEVLGARRREAGAGLRRVLGDRPEGFTAEEWRVVLAVLSPDEAAGATGGKAPSAREAAISRALWCFPGLAAPAALQAYRVAAAAPHVRTIVADVRALEAIDVLEHRSMVRDMLVRTAKRADERMENVVEDADFARLALAQVGTLKALMDLDALKAPPIPADDAPPPENGERTGDHLKALLRRTHDDLASRRRDTRTLPLPESVLDCQVCETQDSSEVERTAR